MPYDTLSSKQRERLVAAAAQLREAERPVRVLRGVAWTEEVAEGFFARGAKELPQVSYRPIDSAPVLERTAAVRLLIDGDSPVHRWLRRVAQAIDTGARMVAAVGTPDFHSYSLELYSAPTVPLPDGMTQPLALARQLDEVLAGFSHFDLSRSEVPATLSAEELAARMQPMITRHFKAEAPKIEIVDHLSAKALAGARYIRLRRDAVFSDRDLHQLLHHEAFVHIGTSLNGVAQSDFPVLAAGHPGTTRTQEGLAVFAEFITGSSDPDRMRRLADRVIAIQMAIEGADFLDLYRYFLERGVEPRQAFENARRVVRGGVLTGGAPFTKDVVYLEGLLRVHNFLRVAVQLGRIDCIRLLFCGKLDIEDLPAVSVLAAAGLCRLPRFLPPWAADLRFLVAYLAYSSFLNRVHLERIREHYRDLLAAAPPLETPAPAAATGAPPAD